MEKILLIEDDIIICGGIKLFLESKGYCADCAHSIREARAALKNKYDLAILDINLPDGNGTELCREIRGSSDLPVIFLTANDTEEDMIEGFHCGCDDYIAKPFSVELLHQRIKAVLRRSSVLGQSGNSLFEYKGLSVDLGKMQVMANGEPVKLSATEYRLLELLILNKGQVMTRSVILQKIWDCDENFVDENTLSVHIRRLRQKLEPDPKNPIYVITVFGIGYTFGE